MSNRTFIISPISPSNANAVVGGAPTTVLR